MAVQPSDIVSINNTRSFTSESTLDRDTLAQYGSISAIIQHSMPDIAALKRPSF